MKTKIILWLSLALVAPAWAGVLPNDAVVEGKTLDEWSAEWWRWVYAQPTNQSPLLDADGSHATNGQTAGSVFFLGGLGLRSGSVTRTFDVPEGSHLFFPVRYVSLDNVDFPVPLSVEELRDAGAGVVALMINLHVVIDGQAIDVLPHRVLSPVFSFDFQSPDNLDSLLYGHPILGLVDPIVSDGYWVMVEPLAAGQHVLNFGGDIGPPFNSSKNITALITVVAIPLSQSVHELILSVEASNLPRNRMRRLVATLRGAEKSFERNHLRAGIDHLRAFQKKVRHLIARIDPALAEQLVQAAQQIIDKASRQLDPPPHRARVLPDDAVVAGMTTGDWTAEWWKRIFSIPLAQNPLFDTNGSRAAYGQSGPVFFAPSGPLNISGPLLALNYSVPEDRFLLVPVANVLWDNINVIPALTVEQLRDQCAAILQGVTELHARIDGDSVSFARDPASGFFNHRAISPVFNVTFTNADNIDTFLAGQPITGLVDPIVGDGYWLMIEPLPPGEHVLETGLTVGFPTFSLSLTHNITVTLVPLTQRVDNLMAMILQATLPEKERQTLLKQLATARTSFEKGNEQAGIHHLYEFQNKVRHEVTPIDAALAEQFIQAAQRIIDRATRSAK